MTALMFPGQGSQYVGMGKDWYEGNPRARALFDSADEILGFPLTRICFEGPEDLLRQTQNTQPAIFLHAAVVAAMVPVSEAKAAAGHSLGEYTALVVAGALSFEDGLRLVRLRGELMQKAGESKPGTMAAVIGLAGEDVSDLCRKAADEGIVQPANFNSPGQVVVSGEVGAVRKVIELARAAGAKMAKELVVSGAFHSPLMEGASEGLKEALDTVTLNDARIPVYANVTGEPARRSSEIRELLHRQLTSPVRWEQTIKNMVRDGMKDFTEIGPGKVLQGLVKRTSAEARMSGIDRLTDAKELVHG
ncbi:MAG: ACP S-malonyltransferase [Ignavibacteria bacterium]|nr:ACP S-malonyltransferase [Ignavibacteria bacterium]